MSKLLSVTVDDWVYTEIETRRKEGQTSRSELVQELLIKGMSYRQKEGVQ